VRRLPARLVVLSLLLAAAPAGARTWPDCLHSGPKRKAPATLADLRACQKKAARRVADQAEARGKPLTDAELDALGEHQREEARRFLARPGTVVAKPPDSAAEAAAETKSETEAQNGAGTARRNDNGMIMRDSNGDGSEPPAEMRDAANAINQRYKKAGVKKVPPEDLEDYKSALQKSGGVITPELNRLIDERVSAAQAAAPAPSEDKPSDGDPNANSGDGGAR